MAALKLEETADSLQMKLNLKKQIWTGTWNEQAIDRTRPLSWGHTGLKTTNQYLELREYDSEQLLIACSRKLTAWQESGKQGHGQQVNNNKQKNNKSTGQTMGHSDRRLNRDGAKGGRNQKGFHVSTASFINRCNITRITELGKGKKLPQNFAMAKIVEATGVMGSQKKRGSIGTGQLLPGASNDLARTTRMGKRSKFRTGGIVVTAVQNHQGVPPKRIRSILPTPSNPGVTEEQPRTSRDKIKSLAKKIKIKIRKKSKA